MDQLALSQEDVLKESHEFLQNLRLSPRARPMQYPQGSIEPSQE